jgi:excalibur calcium-binding domain-containing protein
VRNPLRSVTAAVTVAAVALTAAPVLQAGATRIPPLYRSCKALNAKYPHGVGRPNAVDKTSGERVTTFRRSTKLYNLAMSYNRGLDRDKDRIACEKL